MTVNLEIRFSGVLGFYLERDRMVCMVPNLTAPRELRLDGLEGGIKAHQPALEVAMGTVTDCEGNAVDLGPLDRHHLEWRAPTDLGVESRETLGLPRLLRLTRNPSGTDPDRAVDRSLLRPVYRPARHPRLIARLALPYLDMELGPIEWHAFLHMDEEHPTAMWVKASARWPGDEPLVLARRALDREPAAATEVCVLPDDGSICIEVSNETTSTEPGPHFAGHYDLLRNPGALNREFPYPVVEAEGISPAGKPDWVPASNNAQCSPAEYGGP